jgi:virginiamycin B lyase
MVRPRLLLAIAVCAAAFVPPIAAQTVREFLIPRANAFPHDPAVGADGMVWYTDQTNSYIGRLDPNTGQIVDWPTPTPGSGPHGITIGPDGYVWYTGQDTGRIGRVDPATGAIREFVMPANANRPHTPIWHRGAVWGTAQTNSTYYRLDPVTGNVQVWSAPAGSRPYGIDAAPDGSLWIALFGTNRLARVDTATGASTLFTLPNTGSRPRRIAVAQDGLVYYTDYPRGYLGRLDPATGQVREWRVTGAPPGPYGIAVGTDGRIWFNAQATNEMVAFDPLTEQLQGYPIPTAGAIVRHMVCDWKHGKLWLALSGTRRIGEVAIDVPVTRFGSACSGSLGVPSFDVDGVARIGTTVTFAVGNTAASQAALFVGASNTIWGAFALPWELLVLSSPGCFLNVSIDVSLYAGPPAPVPLAVPVTPALDGTLLYLQWALFGDPSGRPVVTTQGVRLRVVGA